MVTEKRATPKKIIAELRLPGSPMIWVLVADAEPVQESN